jgi:hypothetical protein
LIDSKILNLKTRNANNFLDGVDVEKRGKKKCYFLVKIEMFLLLLFDGIVA